ncbi:hypothetical protein [Fischerella sp. JS2]|uniref:hypothetical protein n=1 Tax=Fischerella sp. JS2 TaxID=2597771 RepID=UPI0028EF5119|nr:hypothetical protein [Fischerella sp. JS2]
MLLHQLVEINEKGSVAPSVNFGMMDIPEINLRLCEEFIFNYDTNKPELSTVGILDAVRRSYHSRNEVNIHLLIQDYGKGKSHFAVAIANFFHKPFDSPEVQGILHQIQLATAGKNHQGITEGLKLYKQRQKRHLVICLSGDSGGNIKKQFLQQLVKILENENIHNCLAQNTCSEPLRYLESLDAADRQKAEQYLQKLGNSDGDLYSLIRLLRENNPAAIATVKNLAREITGFTPDFAADVDIEAILQDILNKYCTGENAHFQGILILFDELNYYLQSWSADQIGAGGTALQNITNICSNNKGKIALLSFAQFHPNKAVGISANALPSYNKISSRLHDKTYDNPASSLELVLNNLLIQKENESSGQEFFQRWNNTLLAESRDAFERRIKIYREQGWTLEKFYQYLGKGSFPLHPLTAYLLCKLDFTQDRTAIQFIKNYVKKFIQTEPAEKLSQLNYIYPIALVDSFIENFSNYPIYVFYKQALATVTGYADSENEIIVLKALFLFHACGEKLTKSEKENHQEILATLTGLAKSKLQSALDKLEKIRDIIYYRPETKTYRFWEGVSPTRIQEDIEEKIKDKPTSIQDVVKYCRERISQYLDDDKIIATKFVQDNKLVSEDWRFEYKIYRIDEIIQGLESNRIQKDIKEKGILAFVLAETQDELQEFRKNIDHYLSKSAIKNQIVVAIPYQEIGDLARILLMIKTLEETDSAGQRLLGAAYKQLLQRWEEQLNTQSNSLLKSCTYHCVELEKISPLERDKKQRVISVLLQELYHSVPPVDGMDKMRSNHATGKQIVGWTARQLFADSLTPQALLNESYKTVIDQIFVSLWGLLKKSPQKYLVQEPQHEKIRAAWEVISQMTDLREQSDKIVELDTIWQALSAPPYGYSEYNFTILLAGWLAYHRKEVSLRGVGEISTAKKKTLSSPPKTQSLKDWANTDILQNPTAFVSDWIVQRKGKIVRRQQAEIPTLPALPIDYEQAQQYLEKVAAFLEFNEADVEVGELNKHKKQVSAGVESINKWFQPVVDVEALSDNTKLETWLQLYPQLLQNPPASLVQPTSQQLQRQTQALQIVNEKIQEFVTAASQGFQSLSTIEACDDYKLQIQALLNQIITVTSLSPLLVESLQNAIQATELKLTEIRQQAEEQQNLAKDMEIMQIIRQYQSATKLHTVSLCEQVIQDAENYRNRLHHPEKFAVEIDQILQVAKNQVTEYRQRLANIQNRISTVNYLRDANQIMTECAELDVVFKETADYQDYQNIKAQINLVTEDLERLQEIENRLTQTDNIAKCHDALQMIANSRVLLHDAERFQKRISDLEANLQQRIQDYTTELRQVEENVDGLTTAKDAQRQHENLLKKSARYANSDAEGQCEKILWELKLLIELLQIAESANLQTWTSCQAQIERLQEWQNSQESLTDKLRDRITSVCTNLEEQKTWLLAQAQAAAQQWLQDLRTQYIPLSQLVEDTAKLTAANNLLAEIHDEENRYIDLLTTEEIQTLENIERQCIAQQQKDIANQIFVLFRELSRSQQQKVYARLGQYLANEAE